MSNNVAAATDHIARLGFMAPGLLSWSQAARALPQTVRGNHVRKRTNWLKLLERSDDPNFGRTLVRLSRLAVAAHQFESARACQKNDQRWIHGRDPRAVVPSRHRTAAALHTEVNR